MSGTIFKPNQNKQHPQASIPNGLTTGQANAVSLLVVAGITAILLMVMVGYRDTKTIFLVIGGITAIGIALAVFIRPQYGAFILVLSLYTNMSSVLGDQGLPGINKALTGLVFISIVANRLSTRNVPRFSRVEWLLIAYGGVWFVSAFVAQDRNIALTRFVDFTKDYIILLSIVYTLDTRPNSWKRAIWLLVISAGVLAAMGTYQVLTNNINQTFFGFSRFVEAQIIKSSEDGFRLVGPLDDPNYYGQILVAVLPLAVYRIFDAKKTSLKVAAVMAALFIAFAIISTYSRGAFLGLVVVLALIALERRVSPSLILLMIPAAIILMQFLPAGFSDRLQTLSIFTNKEASVRSEASFKGRSSEMLTGLMMFSDHPILGVGVGNYAINYQDYASRLGLEHRTEDRQAHSLYLEMAAETGLLGLSAFVGAIAVWFIDLQRVRGKLRHRPDYSEWSTWITSIQFSIVGYLTTSIFLHNDYIRYLWLLIALGIALIHVADYLQKERVLALLPREAQAE